MITNCSVTLDEIKNQNTIFGPNVLSLKRKMVRRQPKTLVSNYIKILKEMLKLHNTVLVSEDMVFFNGMGFLVSIPRHLKFITVQYIVKRATDNISKYLEKIDDVLKRHRMYV